MTWDQGSARGLPGPGGEKLHRPEAEEARQVSQSQDGEHRECGEEPILKQRTDHQVPGIRQKGRQCSSKVGAMAELENTFRNSLLPQGSGSFYVSQPHTSRYQDGGSEVCNLLTHTGKRDPSRHPELHTRGEEGRVPVPFQTAGEAE